MSFLSVNCHFVKRKQNVWHLCIIYIVYQGRIWNFGMGANACLNQWELRTHYSKTMELVAEFFFNKIMNLPIFSQKNEKVQNYKTEWINILSLRYKSRMQNRRSGCMWLYETMSTDDQSSVVRTPHHQLDWGLKPSVSPSIIRAHTYISRFYSAYSSCSSRSWAKQASSSTDKLQKLLRSAWYVRRA